MKPVNYLMLLLLPALVVSGFYLGGWFNFLVPACCFFGYPLANLFLVSSEAYAHAQKGQPPPAYTNIALSFVPVLFLLTAWCIYTVATTHMHGVEYAGLVLSLGIVNSIIGFTLAHEFIHRFTKKEQLAGYFLLLQNNYMHYGIEHVYGHHVYACTPADPHTARIGESLYAFLPRAILNTYRNAIIIERKRLSRQHYRSPFSHNRVLCFGVLQIALMVLIFFVLNMAALIFFLLQNIVAIILLHIINYMQHYGLMRKITGEGRYEKINARHAWNTGIANASLNLFHLENHADHHMHPAKSFEQLKHTDDSPEHPAGYSFMVLLSLIPPLWFRVMNKKIVSNF